ncbi:MAG TPA: caspase family protein [Candidatus Acidoferrum sp.]|nr:caspase family protein [Candidatus Acidoferrum sp.]
MLSRLALSITIAVWIFASVLPAGAQGAREEPKIALLIGNSAYREAPLRNPVNDVRAMAGTLRELGFTVLAHENTTKRAMETAILEFGRRLADGGVGFFYYAGHGLQVRGRNYLVPVDADIESEAATRIAAVDVDLLLEQMAEAKNRVNVVILDACRNNPFERRLRGASKGLAAVDAARGTLIAYATAPGSVAADGEGANGLYTEELLKALRVPGLKVEEVFKQVRVGVTSRSKGAQTPWESSSLTGDLVVNVTVNITTPAAPPPTSSSAPFDGLWAVTIDCPRTSAGSTGADGYVLIFFAKVKDGNLHGQHGNQGQPDSLTLIGKVQPDGSATLNARGMTGEPKHSVNREAKGTPYGWRGNALFEGTRGVGKRTELRSCDLSFVKQ